MSYCPALEASTALGKEGHAVAAGDALDRAGHSVGTAATERLRRAGHSDEDSGALLRKAGHAEGAHQLRNAAAAAEAVTAASAATFAANTAAVVVTAPRSSTACGASVSETRAAWISTGEDCTLRSWKNSSREYGLKTGVSIKVFFTMNGVGYS